MDRFASTEIFYVLARDLIIIYVLHIFIII